MLLSDEQDMRKMGGLVKYITFYLYYVLLLVL